METPAVQAEILDISVALRVPGCLYLESPSFIILMVELDNHLVELLCKSEFKFCPCNTLIDHVRGISSTSFQTAAQFID